MPLIILLGFVVLIGLYIWSLYNGLVSAKMKVDESWSGIDVQLKRRSSLIPNLVETVKGYASHESGVFTKVTEARSALMQAQTPETAAQANNMLTGALKSLFAVAENYPELKANENFRQLQGDLSDTEDKVAYSRSFYNSNVLDFNTKIKVFPAVVLAGPLGFKEYTFFKAGEEEKADVSVKF